MDNLYIEKVLSGDSHAFRYFISTYKDMAFSVALSLVKNEHLAEEVVQDAFVQTYLSLANFRGQSKFSTWFYRIVVNCGYKSMRTHALPTVELDTTIHDVPLDDHILNKLLHEEQKQAINQALLMLSANESLALRLFYLEELSIQEVCEITGWSTPNTKVILHRGRNNMHIQLNKLLKMQTYYGT